MKRLLFTILFISTVALQAQIDRSKQPKPGPAPEINLGVPSTFELDNGLKVIVMENHKLPRISYTLTIDNPPFTEGEKAGVSALTGNMLGKGSVDIDKDAFNDEVDYMGASMNFGPTSAFARGLSKYSGRILELMADAALHPDFKEEEFGKEKDLLLENLKANEKSVTSAARRVEAALAYGRNSPQGEFATRETVNNVSLQDVKSFYSNYFVPKNAYLVIVGDVKVADIRKQVEKYFNGWAKTAPPVVEFPKPADAQYTQINLVDMPNAVQSEIAVENLAALKMSDPDYFPVLLANKILGGGAEARLFLNLREDKGYTYGAYSGISADRQTTSRFRAWASVRNEVTDSAVVAFLEEIDRITTAKVSRQELVVAKADYVGNFVMNLEKPEIIARYALQTKTQQLPKDFFQTYIKKINAVTEDQVLAAAKKYFKGKNARIVVTGKASQIAENLEKIQYKGKKIPIFYFDKYANPAEKPKGKTVDPGVTVKSVLNKYIQAIGGEEKLKSVKSMFSKASGTMQGMALEIVAKNTSDGKILAETSMMGTTVSKQVFNGESGYIVMQGQRKELEGERLEQTKENAYPFPELMLRNQEGLEIKGIEEVNGKDAYVVKNDKAILYFDVDSGLKVSQVITVEAGGGKSMTQTLTFEDYRDVEGIKIPFKTIMDTGMGMELELITTEVKINEGVTDADFE
ncbi:insulinase family protein [Sinomicrobium weinanense]|uniref:Insulinase family protein n=1 Tax=Sinomicrobium weinanense TaxID=2842200 RepID=A0A926JNR1_9FLAO|nr:insulinase family protein [Sinomicrobium weinanense]MBC9794668.1 insulinase family protein [Sinomicrobium weinanense]MBU3124153.1 insulinase family protein [Sinomicrobium weinanense]